MPGIRTNELAIFSDTLLPKATYQHAHCRDKREDLEPPPEVEEYRGNDHGDT